MALTAVHPFKQYSREQQQQQQKLQPQFQHPRDQASWLAQQYSPWCLLHMLLKHHPSLVSTPLLEELLPPLALSYTSYSLPQSHSQSQSQSQAQSYPSQYSQSNTSTTPIPDHQSSNPQSPSHPAPSVSTAGTNTNVTPKAKAFLSRYLVQRLHFGYYGNRARLSESAVRYLTARARLEYGYFVIRGRAFWHVTSEDLAEEHQQDMMNIVIPGGATPSKVDRDAKVVESGVGASSSRSGGSSLDQQRQQQQLPPPQQQRRQRRNHQQQDLHQQHNLQQQHNNGQSSSQNQHNQGPGSGQDGADDPSGNKDEESSAETVSQQAASALPSRRRGGGARSGSGSSGSRSGVGFNGDNKTEIMDEDERRQRILKRNQRCEEREEQLLMLEAVRYLERKQPELIDLLMPILTSATVTKGIQSQSSSRPSTISVIPSSAPSFPMDISGTTPSTSMMSERQEAAIQWAQVALTARMGSLTELDDDLLIHIPSSPFLTRPYDSLWMRHLQHPPSTVPQGFMKPLSEASKNDHPLGPDGGMRMVQDDARLFQISTGIFDKLATHPKKSKKPPPTIIESDLSYSSGTIRDLILEYGYMPLPEDDADRKLHYRGGSDRAPTGETEVFPSDGTHTANKRSAKGPGTSIWYFYDLQPVEVMVGYLVHRVPEVLDLLFQKGFELLARPEPGMPGISRAMLLQCCLPGFHAMLRHILQRPSDSHLARLLPPPPTLPTIVRTIKNELMGFGEKPRRIEFTQQDFAQVLRDVPVLHLSDTLNVLTEIGMQVSVVQERLVGLLQAPGGIAPVSVEKDALSTLETKPSASESLMSATALVNLAIQQSFEIQMDITEVRDREWKHEFEETIMNLKRMELIVHPDVSEWVMSLLDPRQLAFKICFDHALMEALLGISEWNVAQMRRLRRWTRQQEQEARMRNTGMGRQWEEVKRQLLVVKYADHDHYNAGEGTEAKKRLGLDIEWTTNDLITLATSTLVAEKPFSKTWCEMIRISDDGYLLLDNGFLDQSPLLLDQWTTMMTAGECLKADDGSILLESNIQMYEFLRMNAKIEEKHWIWLAMGLVTISLQGSRVIEILDSELNLPRPVMLSTNRSNVVTSGVRGSVPVRMACSPQAYQLVWMMALAYVRQSLNSYTPSHPPAVMMHSNQDQQQQQQQQYVEFGTIVASPASSAAALQGSSIFSPIALSTTSSPAARGAGGVNTATPVSPPLSPVPQSTWRTTMRGLQRFLTTRLGPDARLVVEILLEIEADLGDVLLDSEEILREPQD
ncbi:hypothetical protein BX616_001686 [Lobosporangium transversale]|nr:hypothetical protein BX616_001686 [Lobosporangium transversale]